MHYRTRRRMLIAITIPTARGAARRDDPGDGSGTGTADNGGGTGDAGGAGDGTDSSTGSKPTIKGDLDPERASRAIAAARDAEKQAKAAAKAANERLEAVLKAAGLTPDGKTDPAEQLKAAAVERDKAVAKARQTALELAVYRTAGKAGADADALLDSRGFLSAVDDLDPDDKDFADKVTTAIKDAIKTNPKLAAPTAQGSQGPARQGADHSGGNSGAKQRPTSLGAALAARMGRQ